MKTVHLQLSYLRWRLGSWPQEQHCWERVLRITPSQTFKKTFTPTPKTSGDVPDFFLCSHESPVLFLPGGLVKLSGLRNQEAQV